MTESRRAPRQAPTKGVAAPDNRAAAQPDPLIEPLGDVLDFMRLLWAVDHELQKVSKRMGRTLGVTGLQRLTLRVVSRFRVLAPGKLAEVLHIDPSTLTGVLKRLESRGLLERTVDPSDSRRVKLRLTKKGRPFVRPSRGTVETAVGRTLARFLQPQLRTCASVLIELAKELEVTASSAGATNHGSSSLSSSGRRRPRRL